MQFVDVGLFLIVLTESVEILKCGYHDENSSHNLRICYHHLAFSFGITNSIQVFTFATIGVWSALLLILVTHYACNYS